VFLHITSVELVDNFHLRLAFNSGVTHIVDLSAELNGEVFIPLRSPAFFAQVRLNPETGTIEWPNGADFAPEFLAQLGALQAQPDVVLA
jgi:Protein of unknown function (DUF2442)